jgi:hypothetical protein
MYHERRFDHAVPHRQGRTTKGQNTFSSTVACAALVAAVAIATSAYAEAETPPHCDVGLLAAGGADDTRYRLQSDGRCEGRFGRNDSDSGIQIVHFGYGVPIAGVDPVRLTWSSGAEPTRIRGVATGVRKHHRMDHALSMSVTSYEWPMDVLQRLSFDGTPLGVLAWRESAPNVYIPVESVPKAPLAIGWSCTVGLDSYATKIYAVDRSGNIGSPVDLEVSTGARIAPNAIVLVDLSKLVKGRYRIHVIGRTTRGADTISEPQYLDIQ